MRRRHFITLLGGAAAAWPVLAGAQQGGPVRRIGVVLGTAGLSILRQELQKLGWTEGRNLRIDVRFASLDPEQTAASARELIELAPDLIFTSGGVTTAAVQRQTATIPIVFAGAGGLEGGSPVVRNIARPEGNTTGITNSFFSLGGKWLELLKDAAPRVARLRSSSTPILTREYSGRRVCRPDRGGSDCVRRPGNLDALSHRRRP